MWSLEMRLSKANMTYSEAKVKSEQDAEWF